MTLRSFSAADLRAIGELEVLYSCEWEPITAESRFWIRKMAEARRQIQKADQMEADIFTRNRPEGDHDERAALAQAFLSDANGPNYLSRVSTYREKAERSFHRALKELNAERRRQRQRREVKMPPKLIPFQVRKQSEPKQ